MSDSRKRPVGSRRAKSLSSILDANAKHITKSEVEFRARAEAAIRSNCKAWVMWPAVRANRIAALKFKELTLLYAENPYVERMDSDLMNEYSLLCAEMRDMRDRRQLLSSKATAALRGKLLDGGQPVGLEQALALSDALGELDKLLLKARPQLVQLMDRLLLTPTGRIKSVPKTPPKAEAARDAAEDLF